MHLHAPCTDPAMHTRVGPGPARLHAHPCTSMHIHAHPCTTSWHMACPCHALSACPNRAPSTHPARCMLILHALTAPPPCTLPVACSFCMP
eukprot:365952-Chlamydomonas_euryale.AAC.5